MSLNRLSSTAIALMLASALCLQAGCSSTTPVAPAKPQALRECPKPQQPDPRLLEDPIPFQPLPAGDTNDADAIPTVTANNLGGRQNYDRYVELIRWVKGRSQ